MNIKNDTSRGGDKSENKQETDEEIDLRPLNGTKPTPKSQLPLEQEGAAESLVNALRKILGSVEQPSVTQAETPPREMVDGEQEVIPEPPSVVKQNGLKAHALPASAIQSPPLPDLRSGGSARQLTQEFIATNYGADAVQALLFVDGIAGLAAAQAGIGPTVEEADEWVHNELSLGNSVSIVGRKRRRSRSSRTTIPAVSTYPATSFVAYLLDRYGSKALQQYLLAYDPERQDRAAQEAFHHPLAIVEEEWLTSLRKRGNEREVLRSFLRNVIPLLRPYKWKQFEILVYLLLAAAFNIAQPYSIKIIIDRLTLQVRTNPAGVGTGAVFLAALFPLLLLLLGLYVVNGAVSLRRAYAVNWLNQNILNTLQVKMYAHLQRLPHSFYVSAKIGDIMSRLNSDLDNVQQALSQVTNKALYRGFTIIGAVTALVMLTRKSPELAIPILMIIPLFAASYYSLRSRNKQASREQGRRVGQTMAAVQEHLSAQAVIKAFGMEEGFLSDYRRRIWSLQRSKMRLAMLTAITDLSEDTTTGLAQLIVFGVGGYLVLRDSGHGLSVGDLAALLVLVKSIFGPIASISGIGQTMQQATGSLERVFELFQEPVTIADKPEAVPLPRLAKEIRFENVSFKYGGDRFALNDLSLTIPAGEHVAIVGSSGSGKSTLVNLLLRFWDPEQGRVVFDDNDLRDVTLASLRAQIGLVFQETFIFNTTLRANIALGKPDATDAEIVAAAKSARLDSFVQSLPSGYDTVPGESGSRLSVGQKQRISIARTFLRNPPILILDEATSALDANTEAEILETLAELTKGRTTISVTHRISQAAGADRIFVMDGGRLVEQGIHSELLQANGLYQKLYEQATGFVSGDIVNEAALSAA